MLKQLNKNKKKKGFTLIELVIVLAVLAIIALIAIPNFTKVRNDSLAKADVRTAEQIEKITLMAIADQDIIGKAQITMTFTNKKLVSINTGDFATTQLQKKDGKANYLKMMSEVKAPQVVAGASYDVIINDDMSVDVAYKTAVDLDGDGNAETKTLTK
ncbi:MAG: type II secretion system protein [Sarcina sp.]